MSLGPTVKRGLELTVVQLVIIGMGLLSWARP